MSEKLKISLKANFSLFEEMKFQKIVVFTNLGNTSSPDILRISLKLETCDMPEYHNIFMVRKTTDKLEIYGIFKVNFCCRY